MRLPWAAALPRPLASLSELNTDDAGDAGADVITAMATATGASSEAFDIYGAGIIRTRGGPDRIETDVDGANIDVNSFGGGIRIRTGGGNDFVLGFGHANIDGGGGKGDELAFGFSKADFLAAGGKIVKGSSKNKVHFTFNGVDLFTQKFEVFTFADGSFGFGDL